MLQGENDPVERARNDLMSDTMLRSVLQEFYLTIWLYDGKLAIGYCCGNPLDLVEIRRFFRQWKQRLLLLAEKEDEDEEYNAMP